LSFTDNDTMTFGKFKGTKMKDLPAWYLDWLHNQPWIDDYPQVKGYIIDARQAIDQELEEKKREHQRR